MCKGYNCFTWWNVNFTFDIQPAYNNYKRLFGTTGNSVSIAPYIIININNLKALKKEKKARNL